MAYYQVYVIFYAGIYIEILSPRCLLRETNVNSGYEDNTDPSLSVQTTVKKLVITNNTVRSFHHNVHISVPVVYFHNYYIFSENRLHT